MRHISITQHKLPLFTLRALVGTVFLALAACESAVEPHDDHADEVEGVVLVLGGQTVATYAEGSWTGELSAEPGEEGGHISVRFTNHDGDPVELDEEYYLEVDVEDESIAEFEQDTPGEFGGYLHGHEEGDTGMVFKLMHGAVGSGHADFVTSEIHVHVHEHDH